MIRASDAIAAARALIGTPYSELDCINLIKKVIRTAPGGNPKYTTASTVSLWASYDASPKYRDLTERWENLIGVRAGEIVFKGKPLGFSHEPHHVGIATGEGTVIHSSSVYGKVVETPLTTKEGWTLHAACRYIKPQEERGDGDMMETEQTNAIERRGPCALDPGQRPGQSRPTGASCQRHTRAATVDTPQGGALNLRSGPGKGSPVIGKIPNGTRVQVMAEPKEGWLFVQTGEKSGYVSKDYMRTEESSQEEEKPAERTLEWYVHVPCQSREQAEALACLIPGTVAVLIGGDD